MAWDDEKEVAPGTDDGGLTPEEWNEHVADQKGHSGRHESGGVDEITVEGLSGDLADAQDPKADVTRDIVDAFLDGGTNVTVSRDADTLTVDTTALNDQEVADKIGAVVEGGSQTTVTYDSETQAATITIDAPTQAAFDDHATRHESDGADELSVTGLSGDLADEQDAKPHDIGGATHTADTLENLNSKVSDATLDDTNDTREPEAHSDTHEDGGTDEISVFDLTGDLVGQGLERVNDTLQVLSSIWDGTNVVGDVNNTNTTTEALEAEEASINGPLDAQSATVDDASVANEPSDATDVARLTEVDGKADDPHDNSAHSETFTTADDNVEGFATAGDEGTVPTSQGDGTLAMEEAGGGGEVTTIDPNEAVVDEEPSADDSDADNPLAIAVAGSALASGDGAVAIGNSTVASGDRAAALGLNAESGSRATALGANAEASDSQSTALGTNAEASDPITTALGRSSEASATGATALGFGAEASGLESTALGRDAEALTDDAGTLGVATGDTGTSDWTVPGDFTVEGSKDFEIDHPSKPGTHDLRHGAFEGPVPGGLIYSETVEVDDTERSLDGILPGYITQNDFGTAWSDHVNEDEGFNTGYIDTDTWTLHVEEPGVYDVTLIGERDDEKALSNGKHRTEKPKGERWNGEPRTYYRDDPRFDADEYDDILRVRQKFAHTEDCSPEPCEEAFAGWSVTIETEDGQREKMPGVNMGADLDVVIGAARAKIEAKAE